tara:strand:- start:1430 stop:2419 length:990 start_codon:yes stop_codon:yes gene_type:complete
MAIPYTSSLQSVYDTPRTSQCWVEYPFAYANDNTTRLYHHLMIMPGDKYAPLSYNATMAGANKPLDSLFADDANAFWVQDRNLAPIGNNLVSFDRLFAQVPTNRTEGAPNYSFTFPSTGSAGTTKSLNTIIGTGKFLYYQGRVEIYFKLTAANSEFLNIGDRVESDRGGHTVGYYGSTGSQNIFGFYVIYEKSVSGSNYFYRAVFESNDAVNYQGSVSAFTSFTLLSPIVANGVVDQQRTINSDSLINFRYLKTDDILSVTTERGFDVLKKESDSTYTLKQTVTSSTLPSAQEYGGLVFQGGFISGEAESARRWLGNIWEFQSRRVRAS